MRRLLLAAALAVSPIACSDGDGSGPDSNDVLYSGEANDPVTDTFDDPLIAVESDISRIAVSITGDALIARVEFMAGSMSDGTRAALYVDTDLSASTGAILGDDGDTGADYFVLFGGGQPSGVAIYRAAGTSPDVVLTVVPETLTFTAEADALELSVPLSLLGNPTGPVRVRAGTDQQIDETTASGTLDRAPDENLPGLDVD